MKKLLWGIGGAVLAVLYLVLSGALAIRIIGQKAGAVFDFNNVVVAVTSPRMPYLPLIALATLSVLVVFFLTFAVRGLGFAERRTFVLGFFLVALFLIVWSFLLAVGRSADGDMPVGVAEGWKGWIEQGGASPAVHVVALLAVSSLLMRFQPREETP